MGTSVCPVRAKASASARPQCLLCLHCAIAERCGACVTTIRLDKVAAFQQRQLYRSSSIVSPFDKGTLDGLATSQGSLVHPPSLAARVQMEVRFQEACCYALISLVPVEGQDSDTMASMVFLDKVRSLLLQPCSTVPFGSTLYGPVQEAEGVRGSLGPAGAQGAWGTCRPISHQTWQLHL